MLRGRLRVVALGLEALTLGWVLACGQIEGPPADGSGGVASGGSAVGGATGGSPHLGTGGSWSGSGGQVINPEPIDPELDQCGVALGVFDPPCSADDVLVPSSCTWDSNFTFVYPITDLELPTSTNLRLMLLLPEQSAGLGGATATPAPPYVLSVTIYPSSAGVITEAGFSITDLGATLTGIVPNADDAAPYLPEVVNPESSYYPYREGEVALLDGDTVKSRKRLLIQPRYVCLVK